MLAMREYQRGLMAFERGMNTLAYTTSEIGPYFLMAVSAFKWATSDLSTTQFIALAVANGVSFAAGHIAAKFYAEYALNNWGEVYSEEYLPKRSPDEF